MMAKGHSPVLPQRIALQTQRGDPVVIGTTRITPETRVLLVRVPFAAIVWNRPVAVIIERDGVVTRQPIRALARWAEFIPGLLPFLFIASRRLLHLTRKDSAR